jgi:hypothetical protein
VVLWREDMLKCIDGCERLQAHCLTPESPSRRIMASCCETPLFGDCMKGFSVSIYRGRIRDAPLPSIRVMTSDLPDDVVPPDDGLPRYRGRPGKLMLSLVTTWVSMGFRLPKIVGLPA